MPRYAQNTLNRPRMRRQREHCIAIMPEDVLQEVAQTGVARGVGLAPVRFPKRVFSGCKRGLEGVERVFGFDGGFRGAFVAGVEAYCFAEELSFLAYT